MKKTRGVWTAERRKEQGERMRLIHAARKKQPKARVATPHVKVAATMGPRPLSIRLALGVVKAADNRESSWDDKKMMYRLSIRKAADMAAETMGDKHLGEAIAIMLTDNWLGALDWARDRIPER